MIRDRFSPLWKLLESGPCASTIFVTFGAMLVAEGSPLNYVKERMGHASIQDTVGRHLGHLIPGVGEGT